MARPCDPKSQKLGLTGALNQDPYCDYKIHFPPISQGLCSQQGKNLGPKFNSSQNPTSKSKIRFQCHYEERRKRAEFRRKKIIQKLKKNYAIDVDGLNEDIAREIIMKAEIMEKEKREREKRNTDRMVTMISRLIEEQKYKNRGTKIYVPPWRRSVKPALVSEPEIPGAGDMGVEEESEPFLGEGESQNEDLEDKNVAQKLSDTREHINEEFVGEEETLKLPLSEPPKLVPCGKVSLKRKSSISIEMCLESNPKRVVFNDYVKGKVYVQDLRITNIGLETIHCRYLGIVVHTKGEHRFPVGVAVRDNVKLRPGLCCSTKIRLCSQEDTRELRCSVVYETRRQKNPLHHSWFFVPVVCVPVRALVKVIPTKITFPSLTWCEATGPEGAKFLRKIIRIENTGAKACWCRISNVSQEPEKFATPIEIKGEGGEEESEGESSSTKHSERNFSPKKRFSYVEEYDEEGSSLPLENAEGYVRLLLEELFENIFAAFGFSAKYCIDVPPFSTVQIEVGFFPQYKGFHHETYFMQFEDCDNCKEQAIELVGDIKKIPLTVQPEMIDFRICIANSGVYAGTLTIFNQSKGPYSVVLKVPSSMKNHAHVYPRANTILPLGSSDFSVRFYPRVTLARDAPKYFNENSLILEFPIFIHPANTGACKRDCLKVYVFALVTDYCLELTPPCINFGVVNTLETVRTKIELTNHSLAIQEYGFLNLPKGVRVEPNLGFGKILPKESITLYLLYSPGEDVIECDGEHERHEFQVAVTSIAKYGGFREKLEPYEESTGKEPDLFWEEGYTNKLPVLDGKSGSEEEVQPLTPEEDLDVCEENSSIEGEEFCAKIQEYENKIREFLSLDCQKVSERSYFKKMNSQGQGSCPLNPIKVSESDDDTRLDHSEFGEFEEQRKLIGNCSFQSHIHIINCRAVVVVPRCRISETVILLPATACSSFSLYRFRLECIRVDGDINCSCGFRKVSKCVENQKLQSSFEFQYLCPHIKLEPESGYIKPGDSLPITIIYRPEFPAEQLQNESRKSKAQLKAEQEKQVPPTRHSKGQLSTPKNRSTESTNKKAMEDVMNVPSFERENSDLLSGEKSLDKPFSPFHVVTKLQCVIKTKSCDNKIEKTEVHEMVLICPAIKPNFIYLGNSQEIKFNKIFLGTKSKTLLQIQNISLERTSPSATLLNPTGTFFCPSDVKKVEVDPEHTWRLPLIYAPVSVKGIEKQFFEIYCKSTNIFLTVSGEAMMPDYKITPNFSYCEIEAKLGSLEELKIDVENLSSIEMNLQIRADFEKEGPDLDIPVELEQTPESKASKTEESKLKKEKEKGPGQKEDAKEKKKTKNSGNENFQFWEDVPEIITSAIEELEDISEEDTSAFILLGVGENNEVAISPSGKQLIKIQFKPPLDRSGKKFAIKFAFLLEGVSPLKEIIVVGKIFRGK